MGETMVDVAPEVIADCRSMADTWAPVLRALGNAERLLIMLWLADTDGSVRELEQVTGLSQSLVSYHLAELRKAGLVTPTAVGRTNRYALSRPELQALSELLCTLEAPMSSGA
jgi:DNA-binding transcriptional ArsR family regulator